MYWDRAAHLTQSLLQAALNRSKCPFHRTSFSSTQQPRIVMNIYIDIITNGQVCGLW